jgi:DNA polymerase III epsilon subunit family exonuclease
LNNGTSQTSRNKHKRRSSSSKRPRRPKPIPEKILVTKELHDEISATLDDANYVVFDIETTGGNPEKNGITEIFAIRYQNGKIHDTFYSLVDPEIPVPPIVRRMTGITNKMLKGEPKIEEMMPKFLEFLRDDSLVSHNTIGDMKFLRHFAKQVCDVTMGNFYLCTHLLTEKLASESPDKSLKGLAEFFNLPAEKDLHRAEADAYVTLELFNLLLDRLKKENVERVSQAIRLQGDLESALRLGWAIDPEQLIAPQTPGVFHLYDHQGGLLFLSGAMSLAREVKKLDNYKQLPRQLLRTILRAYEIKYVETNNDFAAMLLECDSLKGNPMKFVPQNWHQRTLHCINLVPTPEGVKIVTGPLVDGVNEAFGPVRDRKAAQNYIEKIANLYGLKMTRKGVVFPKEMSSELPSFFNGSIGTNIAELEKKRRSLTNILRIGFRKKTGEQIDNLKKIHSMETDQRWNSLLDLSGALVVPNETSQEWDVFCIKGGRPVSKHELAGSETGELNDDSLVNKIKGDINGANRNESLSADDVNRANATLWYIYSGRGSKFFTPVENLKT